MAQTICRTCGTQYPDPARLPDLCPICADDRQYVGDDGQTWTSLDELAKDRTIRFSRLTDRLYDLRITPAFAIGQRAFLIRSEGGNILWDCLPFLDPPTTAFIRSLGGLKAIAISHPHYFSLMAEWTETFDCPVYIHENDRQWVMNPTDRVEYWSGPRQPLWDGIIVVNTGGHFPGSCVLHLPDETGHFLLTGDSIYVTRDRKSVTFMYSYPNLIPLPKREIEQIRDRLDGFSFDRIYGAFEDQNIEADGRAIFDQSIRRYLQIFE
ncbi:MBL fold metallo-hydrolase [Larkinella soli]|uniref:MBL fold metallo-hydrolase n=1 Tax=Larkinella soli TaxID=1770527 RepID=UPI000FFC58BE|nr:MBL fold metallo-hydrolase [Larkinella soli]